MKIIFSKVDISNFMSIGEASVDLIDRGYTLVTGVNNNPHDMATSNGSGKSSLLEAIVWCLTGDTMRGNKSVVNSFGLDGAVVTLEFSIDEKHYKIIRSKDHSKYKTNLKIYIDGEDKSGKGIRDSEKLLAEYLPDLTASLIGSVIVLGQGLPTRFTNNSPAGRKEVLEKLCKSDFMIQDLKDRISIRKSQLTEELRGIEDNILQIKTKLDITISSIQYSNNVLLELNSPINYDKLIEDVSSELQATQNTLNQCELELNKHVALKSQLEAVLEEYYTQTNQSISELTDQYSSNIKDLEREQQSLQSTIQALEIEFKRLSNIKDVCPTCGQRLRGIEKPDTSQLQLQISTEKERLSIVSDNLQQLLDELQSRKLEMLSKSEEYISETKENLRKSNESYNNALNSERRMRNKITEFSQNLAKLMEQRSNHQLKLQSVTSDIERLVEQQTQYEKDLMYYNNEKDNISLRLGIINKFSTIVTRDFRGYLLSSIIDFIDTTAKRYCKHVFDTELIEFTLDGNNISITYNGKEYEALSGGERQKVDLIIQFSIRDMLCKHTNFSTNIIALDEIFDNLDELGCSKVIDLISTQLCDISSIFIITHRGTELSIPCDDEVTVVKGADGVSYLK